MCHKSPNLSRPVSKSRCGPIQHAAHRSRAKDPAWRKGETARPSANVLREKKKATAAYHYPTTLRLSILRRARIETVFRHPGGRVALAWQRRIFDSINGGITHVHSSCGGQPRRTSGTAHPGCTPAERGTWPPDKGDRLAHRGRAASAVPVSYTHLRAHETDSYLV